MHFISQDFDYPVNGFVVEVDILGMPRRQKSISYEMKKLGEYLKGLRAEYGWGLRKVAKECNISVSHLGKLEAGGLTSIGIGMLVFLSKFYGIPLHAILQKAGFITDDQDELPGFRGYLRAKFQYSPEALRDMEMAMEIVNKKYGAVNRYKK